MSHASLESIHFNKSITGPSKKLKLIFTPSILFQQDQFLFKEITVIIVALFRSRISKRIIIKILTISRLVLFIFLGNLNGGVGLACF